MGGSISPINVKLFPHVFISVGFCFYETLHYEICMCRFPFILVRVLVLGWFFFFWFIIIPCKVYNISVVGHGL